MFWFVFLFQELFLIPRVQLLNFIRHSGVPLGYSQAIPKAPDASFRASCEYCGALCSGDTPLGFQVLPRAKRAGHLAGIVCSPGMPDCAALAAHLKAKHRCHVSPRMGGLRVAPYVYNTVEEVNSLLAALKDSLAALRDSAGPAKL